MPRTRTTKKLAQRIDMNYFKRSAPLRRWKFWLSVALPVLAVVWLGWHGFGGDSRVYSSGRMSAPHALLAARCEVCHVRGASGFSARAADTACLACHDGAPHHANSTGGANFTNSAGVAFTPSCASCHVEHRGAVQLTATADANCTQCHANLQTSGGAVSIVRNINGFPSQHPEFAVLRAGRGDPTSIKLNHYRHMQPNLTGPNGPVQLVCQDCHRTAADTRPWPYAKTTSSNAGGATSAYMAAPTYANACSGCHTLEFDKRFTEAVAHDKPEVIHAFLTQKFQAYIASHPAELHERAGTLLGQAPLQLPVKPVPIADRTVTPSQWVAERTGEAEQLLWRKTCNQCHVLDFASGSALPTVRASNMAVRFMPNARFDHSAHQGLTCISCHVRANASQDSAELLLPGIATCQQCHKPASSLSASSQDAGAPHEGTAQSGCFECHTYHDQSKRRAVPGRFSIPDLTSSIGLADQTGLANHAGF